MDATGQNILSFMPGEDGKILSDVAFQITSHPCGAKIGSDVATATGRAMTSESVGFPLLRKENESACVVWLNLLGEPAHYGEPVVQMSNFKRSAWIDVGAGVPE